MLSMVEILLAIFLGMGAGIVTGIVPGIHINLISALLITAAPLPYFSAVQMVVFVASMSVTHTFLDFIPGVFLGYPSETTAIAILPAHKLLSQGYGYEAVKIFVAGGFISLVLSLLFAYPFILMIKFFVSKLSSFTGWILLLASLFLILRQRTFRRRMLSLMVFLISGALGIMVFGLPIKNPLFAMLSGLFGVSMLLASVMRHSAIPAQYITDMLCLPKKELSLSSVAAIVSGAFVTLLPGLGPAHAALFGTAIMSETNVLSYISLIGGISTSSMILSFFALYAVGKARNGSAVAINNILGLVDVHMLILLVAVIMLSAGMAVILSLFFARKFSSFITVMPYDKISFIVILLLIIIGFLLSGWLGILVLVVSSIVGLLPLLFDVPRTMAMGCLLLPVIIYFLL